MRAIVVRLAMSLSLALVLVGWAVSSPLGASPDDDYHLASIWCSESSYLHPCVQVPGEQGGASFLVPAVLIESHVCYAFQPDSTAECVDGVQDTLRLTDRINQVQGLYPTGFYRTMSLFASTDYQASVFIMRAVNSLLAVMLLGAFLFVGRPLLQRSALLVLPVMLIPLTLFLVASTNPSSWTIIGSVFFFLFGMNALSCERGSPRQIASLVLAVASAALAIASRVDGSAFIVVLTIAIGLIANRRALRHSWMATSTLALTGCAALVSFLAQGSGPAGSSTTIGESRYVGGLFFTNVLEIPGFLAGAVGAAPLGWLDTRLPGLVATVGLIGVGALAFWGLTFMNTPKALCSIFLVLASFGMPVLLAQQQRIEVLEFVQARYLLPLLIALLLVLALTVPPWTQERFPLVPHATLAALLAISGASALWVNFHRYAFGADSPFWARNLTSEWDGLLGSASPPLVAVGMVATVTFILLALWSYRGIRNEMPTTDSRAEEKT